MKRLLFLLCLLASPAWASNCSPYTYTLTNGTTADANQVMANFNTILTCANNSLAHSGANSDITSLSALATPISVAQGGTGHTTTTAAFDGLSPLTTEGDIIYFDGTHNVRLAVGASSTYLASNGTDPSWATLPSQYLVGMVMDYAGSTAPSGWLLAYGQAISRTTYSALFAVIGTTYGSGDGSTTFNVPDLRGRVVAGKDNMGGSAANRLTNTYAGFVGTTLGATGGDERMQAHTHNVVGVSSEAVYDGRVSGSNYGSSQYTAGSTQLTAASAGLGNSQNVQPTIIMSKIIYTGV